MEDRDKVFSNLKRKTFISRIVQTWLGGGGLRSITNHLIKHVRTETLNPHPGGFTNSELPHQATWTPFLYISRFTFRKVFFKLIISTLVA